jgi:acetyltransferase-like isoleucine patch superfamily enzyme
MTETGMHLADTSIAGSVDKPGEPRRPQNTPGTASISVDRTGRKIRSTAFRTAVQLIAFALPWPLRRRLMSRLLRFRIHPDARIGLSVILADEAIIDRVAVIGHFNYIGRLDRFIVGDGAVIGKYNWISGLARTVETPFFKSKANRRSDLIMGKGALITTWHLIDCTDAVEFEDYASLAGARTQILTHSVDFMRNRQTCGRVRIGAYTVVATGSIILKGVTIAERCIVGAGSVVNNNVTEPYTWVTGNPATFVRKIPEHAKLFHRTEPTVY